MFEGFEEFNIQTQGAVIHGVKKGHGQPLLLLHGYPQTHVIWHKIAQQLADAGASAIELNIYFVPGNLTMTGAEVEQRHLDIVAAVRQAVALPIAVALSPVFSPPGNLGPPPVRPRAFVDVSAGARALTGVGRSGGRRFRAALTRDDEARGRALAA